MKVVVADAGPLIIFGRTCGLALLKSVVAEILVPPAVARECLADAGKPGAVAIAAAMEQGLLTCLAESDVAHAPKDLLLLDAGEMEAIATAKARRCVVLLDDAVGRSVAKQMGVQTTGSLGILLRAKEWGVLDSIAPIVKAWRSAGYFLGDQVVADILRRAGES